MNLLIDVLQKWHIQKIWFNKWMCKWFVQSHIQYVSKNRTCFNLKLMKIVSWTANSFTMYFYFSYYVAQLNWTLWKLVGVQKTLIKSQNRRTSCRTIFLLVHTIYKGKIAKRAHTHARAHFPWLNVSHDHCKNKTQKTK